MENVEHEMQSRDIQVENQCNLSNDNKQELDEVEQTVIANHNLTSSSLDKQQTSDPESELNEIHENTEEGTLLSPTVENVEYTASNRDISPSHYLPLRSCRKRRNGTSSTTGFICPVCTTSLRSSEELSNHVDIELQRLSKPSRVRKSESNSENSFMRKQLYQAFLRVKHSRQKRIQTRNLAYSAAVRSRRVSSSRGAVDVGSTSWQQLEQQDSVCPVCRLTISGTEQQLSRHVDHCLQFDGVNSDEEIEVDDDDDYEEYEWADQTRIRATTMVHRTVAGGSSLISACEQSSAESLLRVNIDDDDTLYYGPTQFTEADLIRCSSDESRNNALLQAVVGSARPADESSTCSSTNESNNDEKINGDQSGRSERGRSSSSTCHICMDLYLNPLTSIQCWHVHCQQCWLRALGVKKLCPQCNSITTPRDLRKIYL